MKVCTNNKCGAEYLSSVKRQLTIPSEMAKKLLNDLSRSIGEYIHDNPSATMDDLIERFGDPKIIADEYISALDRDELKTEIKKSRFIKRIILAIAVAFILTVTITAIVAIIQSKSNVPHFRDSDIVVHDDADE